MERSGNKPKNRLLKLAASAVTFQNQPFSPNRDKRSAEISGNKLRAQARKGFSGPMIPMEARYKTRSSSYVAHEPTSPEVSCIGQIKHKKKMLKEKKHRSDRPDSLPPRDDHFISYSSTSLNNNVIDCKKQAKAFKSFQSFTEVKKKNSPASLRPFQSFKHDETNQNNKERKNSGIRSLFVKSNKKANYEPPADRSKTPSLGQLQRFSSGRNSLSNFDWTTAQISPAEDYCPDDYESDGESDVGDAKIYFSAPIVVSGHKDIILEPRKEINLWKRRTMAQPPPLEVKSQFG